MPDPGDPYEQPQPVPAELTWHRRDRSPTTRPGSLADAGDGARPVNDRTPPHRQIRAELDTAIAAASGGLVRVDGKTGTLLALAGVLLGGGLTVLGSAGAHLPAAAAVTAWLGVGLVGVAVVLLAWAVKPRLDGGFGFPRWARATDGGQLLAELSRRPADQQQALQDRADELHWTSRVLVARYTAIRWAVNLLVTGLAVAGVAAALAMAGGR